jgi:proline iminopeptidase
MSVKRLFLWLMGGFLGIAGLLFLVLFVVWVQAKPVYKVPATAAVNKALPSVKLGGVHFHVRTFGRKEAPVIVVIHGGPGGDFRSLLSLKSLAKDGYRVVFYDQRGTGLSARVPASQLTLQSSVEDLHRIVKWAGKGKPVALLGHSWGGIMTAYYLAKYPKWAKAAVMIEPGVLTSAELTAFVGKMQPKPSWASLKHITASLLASFKVKGPDKQAGSDYFLSRMMFSPVENPLSAYYCKRKPPKGATSFWRVGSLSSQAIIAASRAKNGSLVMPSLSGLKAYKDEVLLLAGACNTWIGPKRQREHKRLFVKATLQVVRKAGHMMHLSQPVLTRKAILAYYHRRGWKPNPPTNPTPTKKSVKTP